MAESTWTLEQLEELRSAIASGAAEIQFKDKRIRYQGASQLRKLLREMEAALGVGSGAKPKKTARVARFNNGL
ncbi:MAG: hypothetical protein AAGG01_12655 [Planctomycetota bacterium]